MAFSLIYLVNARNDNRTYSLNFHNIWFESNRCNEYSS